MRLKTESHSWSISAACISWQGGQASYKPAVYIQISGGMRSRPAKVHFGKKHPITCFSMFHAHVRPLWGCTVKVLKYSFKGALCSSGEEIHCLKLETWQGPPHINIETVLLFSLQVSLFFSLGKSLLIKMYSPKLHTANVIGYNLR